jgi:DNA-binding phage protein
MALSANFIADFSSFIEQTRASVAAMQGFKETAEEMGPAADRGLADREKQFEQLGRQIHRVGADALAAAGTFIQAFAEEQEAVAHLTAALEANGQAAPAVIQAYADMASQFQNTTKYADDAITSAQAVLTTIGDVGPEQMQAALTAVTNLASGMKIDLSTAAELVAKAFATGGENLGRLKTVLGDTVPEGAEMADVLAAINEKFGGQAQKDLETYNGQMAQLNNQLGDFQEQVGKVLVDNLTTLLHAFQSLPEGVQTFTLAVVGIGTALAPVLVSLASLVSILSTPVIATGLSAALSAILPFLGPAGLIAAGVIAVVAVWKNWDAIVGFVKAVHDAVATWLVNKFNALVDSIKEKIGAVVNAFKWMYSAVAGNSYVPDMVNVIRSEFGKLDSVMVQPAKHAAAAVTDAFAGLLGGQFTSISDFARYRGGIADLMTKGGAGGGGPINVTINMSGMMGTDDPQTRSMLRQLVGEALMEGMREARLLGRT